MLCAKLESGCLVVIVEENLDVFLEIEQVSVLFDVLTFLVRTDFVIFYGSSAFVSEQKSHVDIENYEELSDGNDGKFKRYSNCFHADFLHLDELRVGEFSSDRGVIVVVQ